MVIDFHTHVLESYDDWGEEAHNLVKIYNPVFYDNFDYNMSLEGVLKDMDECGIDYCVVLPGHAPLTHGVVTDEFASINSNSIANPAKELKLAIDRSGFKGIKVTPSYSHFYPNEARIYPVYELASNLNIPVMVHTGSSVFRGSKLKYGDPLYLDEVAVDFPGVTIIQCHGGRGFWYDRAFFSGKIA